MLNILIVIVISTFITSAIILSKYIDFAKFMLDRKDAKENLKQHRYQDIQKIYIDSDENIIIDVEAEEIKTVLPVKILENKYL